MNCPACRTVNPEGAKFCLNCGTSLSPSAAGAPPPKSQLNLDQYLPGELVAKLQSARLRGAMLGERRVITMLFCDVKGSTAAAEKIDPEIWSDIINGVFERMIQPVYKYEGLVPRLMGDAILAFFGAPIAHEDDPRRAVLAALEIQDGVRDYIDRMRRTHGLEFGLRVGINTGLVVVGEIGSDLRMEYTAIGDAINLAARMEQTAQPGTVQIAEDTYKLVAPFFECEALGDIEVKGKTEPVKAWRVLRAKEKPGQLRGLEGLSSPIVGREAQLSLLAERLNNLRKGSGSFITLIGEAGLGKSTLIAETQRSDAANGFTWCRGDALSYTRSISYFPWRQLIRQSIGANEGDAPAEVRHKLGYVCDCCTLPGGDIPFLEAMLAVESQASLKVVMNFQGEALVQRMLEAVQGYLCGLAQEAPLALVLDDLHWADEATLNLLLGLSDLTAKQPILFICLLRPDRDAASWAAMEKVKDVLSDRYRSITLQPLPMEETGMLLANLLGSSRLPEHLQDLIVGKAQGNPFFVEELIRSLIETGQLVRQNGGWRLVGMAANAGAIHDLPLLPDTLRGVLGARIDRLPENTRNVLQNAAVIGRSFDLGMLERLTHLNGDLASHIQTLQNSGLIEPEREGFAFRHVLIQEAAYDSILIKRRAELHLQIGESLEDYYAHRLEEFAPLLARHFYAAHDSRSLKYDLLAGEKAARLYANVDAVTHFSRALQVAKANQIPADQIGDIYSKLGSALELSGRYEQALQNYDGLQAFGQAQHDRSIELSALMAKATIYSTFTPLHNSKLSEETLVQALDLSRQLGDSAAQARLHWNLMLNYLYSKHLDQALEQSQVALRLARETGNKEYQAFVLNDSSRLYTCRGEFEKSLEVIRQARQLWAELDNQVMLADSLGSEAEAFYNSGNFEQSLDILLQALHLSEKIENLWGQSYDHMLISFVYFQQGRLGSGIQHAEQGVALGEKAGLIASNSLRSELAWVYAYCGAYEKGFELIEQALQEARARQPDWFAFPQAAKVRMHLLAGDVQSAVAAAGGHPLIPVSIPYARYTVFLCLANVELAVANKDYQGALTFTEELLEETLPLTRVDIPEVLRWKAGALFGLQRVKEAHQVLIDACSRAQATGSNLHLWPILVDLALVNEKLGRSDDAAANRRTARAVVEQIADSLIEVGLRETFLNQPRLKAING